MSLAGPRVSTVWWLTAALLLALLPGPFTPPAAAAPADPRTVTLRLEDLPPDYQPDPTDGGLTTLPDGGLMSLAAFRRTDGSDPGLIRNTVYSLTDSAAAKRLYATLPGVVASQGFAPTPTSAIGDESAGYTSPDTIDGVPVVYETVMFRQASFVVLMTLVGAPATTTIEQASSLAQVSLARISPSAATAEAAPATEPALTSGVTPAPSISASILPPSPTLPGSPGMLTSALLTGAPDVGVGIHLGGFSGLQALDASGTRFATVTDRGPNGEIGSGKNKKVTFPLPSFNPSILTVQVTDGNVQVVNRIPLKLGSGYTDPVTGSSAITGLPTGGHDEQPWTPDGASQLGTDPNGVDTEGLAVDRRDGSYWVCEEYGPSILHVAADGTILARLVPSGLQIGATSENLQDILPKDLTRRKNNRGFEGIGLSPDGSTVIAIMQSPLSIPDKNAGEASRNIRVVTLDVTDPARPKLSGMYLYLAGRAADIGAAEQDDVKVGDLAAISPTRVLVAERDSVNGGRKTVFSIDLAGATNIVDRKPPGNQSFEEMSDADLKKAGITPVAKSMTLDLTASGYSPEKVEGLAIVDDRTIAVVNDNDFGFSGLDGTGHWVSVDAPTRLVIIRLANPLR